MATAAPTLSLDKAEPAPLVVVRHSPLRRLVQGLALLLAFLLAILLAAFIWINSDGGRRFVVDRINGLELASGLRVHVDEIEGSLFGPLTVRGLTLSDLRGPFLAAPVAQLDYRPLAYLQQSRIDIRSLVIPEARLARLPELRTIDPNAPLIPDIDVDIAQLRIGRLVIDPPVTGNRHALSIAGDLHLADSAARANLDVAALAGPGLAGGDRLALRFETAPEQNRLNMEMRLRAPGNGFVAGLTGLDRPLDIAVNGRGDWAAWRGRARAQLAGADFADLTLQAENGTFTLAGPLRPDLFVTGPAQRLAEPLTQLNLVTTWANRRADLNLRLNSRALAIASEGTVDLTENRFESLRIAARLLRPGAIAPDLSGRDVRLALVLDGAFRTPVVAYELTAATLGMAGRTIEGLQASGRARVNADRIIVPVTARARRILGFDANVADLLTNVTATGDLAVAWPNILSDNLRVRSDRADAVLALAIDVAAGRYNVGVQGRVDDYLVQSVGVFDINTDLDLVTLPRGGFGLQGSVGLRSKRIFNTAAADLLGGNAVATANLALAGDGAIRFDAVRVTAPALRITEGGGVYYPDGRLALRLRGNSRQYGNVAVEVTGTLTAPQIRLEVASPGFGVGLSNIRAFIRSTAAGYAIDATGDSAYGPFSADVLVLARAGPLTLQINRLLFSGLTFAGRVAQTAAGPFAGSLSVDGQGVDGNIALAAAGRRQQFSVDAVATDAIIPASAAGSDISIQRALIDLDVTLPLPSDAFAIYAANGDIQVAGLRSGSLLVDRGRAVISYAGNAGNVRFVAAGSSGVAFDIAGNADLSPRRIRAALRGTANNIPFRLAEPALIERVSNDWVLRPATVLFREGQGSLRLAGRYGDGIIVQSRLDNLDLAIANTLQPRLGLGGTATGSFDFFMPRGGAFPRAEARLAINGFTRTGLAMRSTPVNIALAGALRPEGGNLSAVVRQNDAVIGRIQAQLQPSPAGTGAWTSRLYNAPLTGGVRYNGPASVLTSLASFTGHDLSGQIGIGADFTGRVDNPQFSGVVRANDLVYTNALYGTRIINMAIDGRFNGSQLDLVRLTGRAGEGTVTAEGEIGLSSRAGYPIRIDAALQNARLARSDDLSATATGNLQIRNLPNDEAVIRGRLSLSEIRYQIIRQGAAQIPQLAGVRRMGEPLLSPAEQQARAAPLPSAWRLDLQLVADNRVFVSGMGLESEWGADLRVAGTTAAPQMSGNINLVRGTLGLAGRRFILDGESNISFPDNAGSVINPQLAIRAVSDIDDVQVEIRIDGSSTNPQISFASTPNLPQDEVVSRILFGSSVTEISAIQAIQLAASLNSLRGGGGGLNPLGALRNATGIDRLRILGEDDTVGRGTAIAAGFYLTDDIYLEIITDARGFTATQLEVALSRSLSLLSQFGTTSGTNVNLRYSRDY